MVRHARLQAQKTPTCYKLRCGRHRNLRASCKRRITDACKVECDRHRSLRAHYKRRIAGASEVAGTTVIATGAHVTSAETPTCCNLRCDRHRNVCAPCARRITKALQILVRPSSQLARTVQAQDRWRVASGGATVIAAGAHIANSEKPKSCNLRCGRHRNVRARCTRRNTNTLQIWVRPLLQLACTLQAQDR